MKNKILALLIFVLFIVWFWFSWQWIKTNLNHYQTESTITAPVAATKKSTDSLITEEKEIIKYGPLVFNWNAASPITNDLWPELKNKIQSESTKGKILRIIGPYFKEEDNNTSFKNIGLARADAVRKMLTDIISIDKMEIDSKLFKDLEDAQTVPFGKTAFEWKIRNENIKEIDNKVLIYFPYNSNKKIDNENINNYLKGLANTLKKDKKVITIIGHTDNKGLRGFNMKLGLDRAKAISSILLKLGVEKNRISIGTSGHNEPIASNDTEEGRQQNRRVEIEIIDESTTK